MLIGSQATMTSLSENERLVHHFLENPKRKMTLRFVEAQIGVGLV